MLQDFVPVLVALAKSGGYRELERLKIIGRATAYWIQEGVTKRLQNETVRKLKGYVGVSA